MPGKTQVFVVTTRCEDLLRNTPVSLHGSMLGSPNILLEQAVAQSNETFRQHQKHNQYAHVISKKLRSALSRSKIVPSHRYSGGSEVKVARGK